MSHIYFDNSATTPVCPAAADRLREVMCHAYGNPSSLHQLGFEASRILEESRSVVAAAFGADSSEVIFTGSGSESNNLALLGAALSKKRAGKRIVSSAIEHPSVTRTLTHLEAQGFEVVRLAPDVHGNITKEQLFEAVNNDTVLVSLALVNNELGSLLPVSDIAAAVKQSGSNALIHCDAVQAFGKMPLSVSALRVDLLSVSAHKAFGPKGVGALYIKKGITLSPVLFGGSQERNLRPGTQNLPAIAGFAAALESLPPREQISLQLKALSAALRQRLSAMDRVVFHSDTNAFPSIVNFSMLGFKSEVLLHFLSQKGIFVSNGAACAKGKPSEILTACGIPAEQIQSALRVSFSYKNTLNEVFALCEALAEAQNTLRG